MSFNNKEKETMFFNPNRNKINQTKNQTIYSPFECNQHLKGFFLLTIVYFNIF